MYVQAELPLAPKSSTELPPLFADKSDDELLGYGVPAEWLTDVKADELLSTIVAQVLRMGTAPGRPISVVTDFDPIRLTPDQAVPLSLILTEALTNALKHGGQSAAARTHLLVTLRRTEPEWARLEISNSMMGNGQAPRAASLESTGLGQQLLAAFASQLMGTLTVGPQDDAFVVRLDFPLRALNLAEENNDAA